MTDMTAEMRSVFNVAYKIGVALGRKFEASDLTPELRQAARMYAASYEGDFDYMVGMRDQVVAGTGAFFTDGQSKGVLNCLMADARRRLAAKPQATVTDHAGRVYLSTVPDGRYRVTLPAGDHLAIKLQLAGTDSKLAGARVISTRSGGDEWMGVAHVTPAGNLKLWKSLRGELLQKVIAAVDVLDDSTREDAWLVAGLAFAQEGSQCFFCGRDLDTPESLLVGYGPTCADNHGLSWGDKAIPMSVRLAQAASAEAAPVAVSVAPAVYTPRAYVEAPELVADRARDKVMIARAAAEGRPRTYQEIFGED